MHNFLDVHGAPRLDQFDALVLHTAIYIFSSIEAKKEMFSGTTNRWLWSLLWKLWEP